MDQQGRGRGLLLTGFDPVPNAWPQNVYEPIYHGNNSIAGTSKPPAIALSDVVVLGRDVIEAFVDTLANRPTTCTPPQGFWASDTQTLYTCSSPNVWTSTWTGYTYPHPLIGVGPPPPPPPPPTPPPPPPPNPPPPVGLTYRFVTGSTPT